MESVSEGLSPFAGSSWGGDSDSPDEGEGGWPSTEAESSWGSSGLLLLEAGVSGGVGGSAALLGAGVVVVVFGAGAAKKETLKRVSWVPHRIDICPPCSCDRSLKMEITSHQDKERGSEGGGMEGRTYA